MGSEFDKFGTHFVTRTVLGGRMHLQQEMTSESYQELITMGVNIKAAAELNFNSILGVEADLNRNDKIENLNAFESKIQNKKEIFLGGKPTQSSHWEDWYETVLTSPVPIRYNLKSISDLFSTINFKNLSQTDLNSMKAKYIESIGDYCVLTGCSVPLEDPALPTMLKNNLEKTPKYGSNMNNNFDDFQFLQQYLKPTYKINKVFIQFSNDYITSIQFSLSDSVSTIFTPVRGSLDNTLYAFELKEDEFITQIDVWAFQNIDSIRFITNKGRASEKFGPGTGPYHMVVISGQFVGVYGRFDEGLNHLTSIGFIENIVQNTDLKNRSCPVLWSNYKDNCYFVSKVTISFANAKRDCENKYSNLVIINSQDELDFVNNIINYDENYYVNFNLDIIYFVI